MDKLVKLGQDMALLWANYGSAYWAGIQNTIILAVVATVIGCIIGLVCGILNTIPYTKRDSLGKRFVLRLIRVIVRIYVEVFRGTPMILQAVFIYYGLPYFTDGQVAFSGNSGIWLASIIVAMGISGWIGMSRLVRANTLRLKESEHIMASRTLGTRTSVILFREIFPNLLSSVIVMAMMSVPGAIFMESFLSFVGLGIPAPQASLGSLISDGYNHMLMYPYQLAIPAVFFGLLMISLNLVGDGLRDALDPKQKQA